VSCLLRLVPSNRPTGDPDVAKTDIFRTSVQKEQCDPCWNEEFQWTLSSAPEVASVPCWGAPPQLSRKTQKQYTHVSVLVHDVQTALLEISLWDTVDHRPRACSKFVGQVCPRACASASTCLATAPSRPPQDERVGNRRSLP
jgi:hypothetical protein